MEGAEGINTWQQQTAKPEKEKSKEKTAAQKERKARHNAKRREKKKRNKKLAAEGQKSKIFRYVFTLGNMIIITHSREAVAWDV